MKKRALAWALGFATLALGASEVAYRIASHAPGEREASSCAVLVLGYPTPDDGSPGTVQRFRVGVGVAVYRAQGCSRLVLSGGAVRNAHVEADAMAGVARSLGVDDRSLVPEPTARSTWENVGCSMPQLEAAERIFIVSDALHARRGKRYACRQRPDLCPKVVAAGANPPLPLVAWKLVAAANELRVFVRDRAFYERSASRNAPVCPSD